MTNPYAPPSAVVADVGDFRDTTVPADRGARLGAAVLDGFIFAILVYVPLFVGMMIGPVAGGAGIADAATSDSASAAIGVLMAVIGFLAWLGLTLYFLKQNSQSIAKRVVGIKLTRSDGTPVAMSRVILLRNILNSIIGLVPLYSLIDILFIFGESRQCLHDKIADTIVVKA